MAPVFAANGVSVVEGPLEPLSVLRSGTLRNRTNSSVPFEQDSPGNIKTVLPDRSNIALLGFGAVGLIGHG